MKPNRLFRAGNFKLDKSILSFSLPAGKEVCNRECAGCYAIKAQKQYKGVLPYRQEVLALTKSADFVTIAVDALKHLIKTKRKIPPRFVRIHQSGDFYSQEYIDKWVEIIKQVPELIFYSYSKRLKEFNFTEMKKLPNSIVKDSFVGDKINFGKHEYLEELIKGMEEDEYFICPDVDTKEQICGSTCTHCMEKDLEAIHILFRQH